MKSSAVAVANRLAANSNRRQGMFSMLMLALWLIFSSLQFPTNAAAGEADVLNVDVRALGNNRFKIDVTVEHADAGWDHYANRWDVLTPEGEILGERILAHPHDNEQPFTRSLTITIPKSVSTVTIRANDSVHGLGGLTINVDINHE